MNWQGRLLSKRLLLCRALVCCNVFLVWHGEPSFTYAKAKDSDSNVGKPFDQWGQNGGGRQVWPEHRCGRISVKTSSKNVYGGGGTYMNGDGSMNVYSVGGKYVYVDCCTKVYVGGST